MHKRQSRAWVGVVAAGALVWGSGVAASEQVTCESTSGRRHHCNLRDAGRVSLERKMSRADCRQGRDWGYNRREIWVDHGCRARFRVDTYGNRGRDDGHSSNHDAKVAVGVVAGAVLLGALIHHANKTDQQAQTYTPPQSGGYVPAWAIGSFDGHNAKYDADVRMTIQRDGRMTALVQGQTVTGWVNGSVLHVDSAVFTLEQVTNGFMTYQQDDRNNYVHYTRRR